MHLVCLGSHFYLCFILVVELKRYGAQLHVAPTPLAARPGWQVTEEKANDKGAMRLKFDGGWVSCAFCLALCWRATGGGTKGHGSCQ